MEIKYKNINELIPYINNTRTHSSEQVQQIASSIKEFGFTNPVLIDNDGGIIAGHGRVMGAKLLKIEEVPCIVLSGLSEAQKKAYIIADNKIALNAGWDEDLLQLELLALDELGFDYSELGFDFDFDIEENEINIEPLKDEKYTDKIKTPIYEIKGEKPNINELYNFEKSEQIIDEINSLSIDKELRDFLISSAQRHTLFNYEKIAEFYAHQDEKIQNIMEKSALVILDFNKAIENGFVELSEKINEYIDK